MADIRSLLRQELAARGADSPSAPTRIPSHIKKRKLDRPQTDLRKKMKSSETLQPPANTQSGLVSEQETSNAEESAMASPDEYEGDGDDELLSDSRPPATTSIEDDATTPRPRSPATDAEFAIPQAPTKSADDLRQSPPASGPVVPVSESDKQAVNEDEWAAFERDVVEPTKNTSTFDDHSATIYAAPVSIEQLEKEQSAKERQKQAREAEEGIREDAERFLEDEFDEMEGLSERLQRLKEKREEIKKNSLAGPRQAVTPAPEPEKSTETENLNDDDEEDDDEEDDENWLWRAR